MIEVKSYLDQLRADTVQIIKFIKTEVMVLDEMELAYKPDNKKWSILECVEHMNIATRHYVDIIQEKIPKALSQGQNPVKHYKKGVMGKIFVNLITPAGDQEIKSKMKTMSRFKPFKATEKGKSQVIDEFVGLNETLLDQLSKAGDVNVNKVRIKSGIGSIIRFKLPDAFGFVVGHNQRHVIQIKELLKSMPAKVASGN